MYLWTNVYICTMSLFGNKICLKYEIIKFGNVEIILKCDLASLNLNVMHDLDTERKING